MNIFKATKRRAATTVIATAAAVVTQFVPAQAEERYPSRPIEIVVPFSPGGSGEMSARVIQPALEEALGQPIVVVTRPGAATNIGTFSVVKAKPDGYTLLMGATALTANPHIYEDLEFDPLKDLVPITIVANSPLMLAANPELGVKNAQDVIKLAKERPGELNFASSGIGSSAHLNGEYFKHVAGVDVQHVPYNGGGPAMLAVTSGEVGLISSNVANLQGLVDSDELVPIGVAASERSSMLPDVPTFKELGFDLVGGAYRGIAVPKSTPEALREKISNIFADINKIPALRDKAESLGFAPIDIPYRDVRKFIEEKRADYLKLAEEAGIGLSPQRRNSP